MYKKLLSILLAVAMLVSMVPAAYAEDEIVVVEEPEAASDGIVIVDEPDAPSDEIVIADEPAGLEANADNSVGYRALLVGEVRFSFETANRNEGDTRLISEMLSSVRGPEGNRYETTVELDLSIDGIHNAIQNTFSNADSNDVSLFFMATHGVTNIESGPWAGALLTVEEPGVSEDYLKLEDLADWLKAVPGKVIVVLGSCGSGAAILNNGKIGYQPDATGRADRSFSESVIRCFEEADRSLRADEPQTGEFCDSKFYVLTAAAHQESSWGQEGYNPYNYFPYYFALGADSDMPADSDADNTVTLNEMYLYCLDNAAGPYYDGEDYYYQHTQVYPENSSYPLFVSGVQSPYDSIADALAGANGESFTVEGVVTMIDGKNVYVQDATGGICLYLSANPSGLALGDTVIGTGARATYRGLPELSGASCEKAAGLTLRAADRTIGTLTAADICTYVKLTKLEVTEVNDNNGQYTTPNITVSDEEGGTIQIYKAVVGKTDGEWNVKVGDVVDFTGAVGVYNTTLQLRNTLESEIQPWYDPSLPLPLTLDTEATANITEGGAYAYFSYTPDDTDFYKFTSFAESDTYGYLYDADWNVLAEDDDSGEDFNFRVSAELQAGNTYYFGARYYSSERVGSFPVLLSRDFDNHFSAAPVQSELNVPLGETATLEMSVSGRDLSKVSYAWYDEDWNRIEGETGSSLTTPSVRSFLRYLCEVQDGYGYDRTFEFRVAVETHFSVQEPDAVLVPMGERATLEAEVYSDYPDHLSYQWYSYVNGDEEPTLIEGATGRVCVTEPINDSEHSYLCLVSDGFGRSAQLWFNLLVDTHFSAEAVQEEISVSPGGSATLEVLASSDLPLSYQWYDAGWNPIEGATGSSYTTGPVTEDSRYYCYVSDGINYTHVWFGVTIDTHFTSWIESSSVYAPLGGTAVLEVFAQSDAPEQISYQWYQGYRHMEDDGDWWWSWDYSGRIEGATGSRLTVENVTEAAYYVCQVTDGYGSGDNWGLNIYVDTHFSARAEKENLKVSSGESAELKVLAESDAPERISYQWYRGFRRFYGEAENDWYWTWDRSGRIEDETGSSLTVGNVTEAAYYVCEVSDGFGSTEVINFTIYLDVHLSVWAEQTEFLLPLGETVTMEVFASSDDPDRISYQWYKERRVTDGEDWWWSSERIEGATGSSLTSEPMTDTVYYSCTVYDGYGDSDSISFSLRRDSHFTAEAVQENFLLSQGETATMEVAASSDEPELISYQWYKAVRDGNSWSVGGNEKIPGATGSSLTSDPVDEDTCYMCRVSDGHDTEIDVWFFLSVQIITPLELDVVTTAEVGSENLAYFSYTPAITEVYEFSSLSESDTYGYLYDADWNVLTEDDDSGEKYNFRITAELQAGETYYFGARFYSGDSGSFPVVLRIYVDNEFSAWPEEDEISTPYGQTAEMQVNVSGVDLSGVTYQWVKCYKEYGPDGNWFWSCDWDNPIAEATGSSLTSEPVTEAMAYCCLIRDGYGNDEHVWFYLSVETHFEVWTDQFDLRVPLGETVTLRVSASSDAPELIGYQWERYDESLDAFVAITGATGSSYTTEPISGAVEYRCSISDGFGNVKILYFYIYPDTHFSARAAQPTVVVPLGEPATLEVIASSDYPLSYEWYYYGEALPEDGPILVTSPMTEGDSGYTCRVSDGYQTVDVFFYIYIETDLTVTADPREFFIQSGESVDLAVVASSLYPELINYEWYKCTWHQYSPEYGEWSLGSPLAGADGPQLTTGPIDTRSHYECFVWDGYGRADRMVFDIYIDVGFSAEAVQETVYVPEGQTAQLAVNASVRAPGQLSYQWYSAEADIYYEQESYGVPVEIPGATGSTLTTDPVTEFKYYFCSVSDGVGDSKWIVFKVYVQTAFSAVAEQESFFLSPNASAALRVIASCSAPGELSYSWYEYRTEVETGIDGDVYEMLHRDPIDNTGSALTLEGVTAYRQIVCLVSDGTGNMEMVNFYVHIQNHFRAEAVNPENHIPEGGSVELKLLLSGDDLTGVTYQWYRYTAFGVAGTMTSFFRPIAGATDSSYFASTEYERYRCVVKDRYGTPIAVDFKVYKGAGPEGFTVSYGTLPSGVTVSGIESGVLYSGELSFTVASQNDQAVIVAVKTADGYEVLPCTTDSGVHRFTLNVTANTELALIYRGDADNNGKVNMRDGLAIKKHSAGTDELSGLLLLAANADADAGGKVNMRDGLAVKKDSAGTDKIKW